MATGLYFSITANRIVPSCLGVILALVFPNHESSTICFAADFRHAKQIYVPPSLIPRRYDPEMMQAQVASPYAFSPSLPNTMRPSGLGGAKSSQVVSIRRQDRRAIAITKPLIPQKELQKAKAKAEFQQALELNPDYQPDLRQLGIAKFSQNDLVGANRDLSRALILDPNDKAASQHLIELWQRQVSSYPEQANAHLGLARAYQLSGDLTSAQCEYNQVARIDPNHPNLGPATQSLKLAWIKQEGECLCRAAKTLESEGALDHAYKKALQAVELCPKNVDMRLQLAGLCHKLNLNDQARKHYVQALRQDPKNEEAREKFNSLPVSSPASASASASAPTSTSTSTSTLAPAPASQSMPQIAPNIIPVHDFGTPVVPPPINEEQQTQPRSQNNVGSPSDNSTRKPRLSTTPHANSITSFLLSWRNLILTQKRYLEEATRAQRNHLQAIATLPPSTVTDSAATPVPSTKSTNSTAGCASPPYYQPELSADTWNGNLRLPRGQSFVNVSTEPCLRPPIQEAVSLISAKDKTSASEALQNNTPNATTGGIIFELEGVNITGKHIKLEVVLKNGLKQPFLIPINTKAIIQLPGRKATVVQVGFPYDRVPPGSQLRGTIDLPFKFFPFQSDCYLPEVLPSQAQDRNLHLTVPIFSVDSERTKEL